VEVSLAFKNIYTVNCTFVLHSVLKWFMLFLHYTATESLHSTHRLDFLMEAECVLCEVENKSFTDNVDSF